MERRVNGAVAPVEKRVGARTFRNASVVIPTKNRPHELAVTVLSLLRQSVLPRELIVVDQSADRTSRERIEQIYGSLSPEQREDLKLCYLREPAISGAATARNAAMEIASREFWVFLDDDVILEPDFLEQLLDTFSIEPNAAGAGGVITNYGKRSWLFRFFHWLFMRGPFVDERQHIYLRADVLREFGLIPVTRLGGGLMAFRASEVATLRFDSQLCGASEGEDVDFCARLRARGAELYINPRARLEHKKTDTARSSDHWVRAEVRGNTYLFRRCWNMGVINRCCYWWLMFGYSLMAAGTGLKLRSLAPWRAVRAGMADRKKIQRWQEPQSKLSQTDGTEIRVMDPKDSLGSRSES
jgi:GT2 family glycosyltransferase